MAINLQKGQTINLEKDSFDLTAITIGLGWDVNESTGVDYDLDAFAILCGPNGKMVNQKSDLVYFKNLEHESGAVKHTGDNRTGEGEGDDEQIIVKLNSIPSKYDKIIFCVNIYKGTENKQHFGNISNSFIRAVDNKSKEIARYSLNGNEYTGKTGMIFAEVYRKDANWKFRALGNGADANYIMDIAKLYI